MEDWLKCQIRLLVKYRQNQNVYADRKLSITKPSQSDGFIFQLKISLFHFYCLSIKIQKGHIKLTGAYMQTIHIDHAMAVLC